MVYRHNLQDIEAISRSRCQNRECAERCFDCSWHQGAVHSKGRKTPSLIVKCVERHNSSKIPESGVVKGGVKLHSPVTLVPDNDWKVLRLRLEKLNTAPP